MKSEIRKFELKAENIDRLSEEIREFYAGCRVEHKEVVRLCIMTEEALLKYRETFGEETVAELRMNYSALGAKCRLTVYCGPLDPFEEENGGVMTSLLTAGNHSNHIWKYNRSNHLWNFDGQAKTGRNDIVMTMQIRELLSAPAKIAICLGVGVLLALLIRQILGAEGAMAFSEDFVFPVADTYTGLLSVMAIVMIFCALPICIVQYGNSAAFQDSTKKLIRRYFRSTILLVLVVCIAGACILGVDRSVEIENGIAKSILDLFLGFFPSNIVSPFLNFNCMQVLIVGMMFGFAFLKMGESAASVVELFDKVNYVAVIVNHWFTKFIHIYVGLMAFYLTILGSSGGVQRVVRFLLVVLLICILMVAGTTLYTAGRLHMRPWKLFRKFTSSLLINVTSASVGVSFVPLFDELTVGCGCDIGYTGMATNLGTIFYKPMYAVFLALAGFWAAYSAGALTWGILIQILIFSILLPATIPNIQGGAASVIVLMIGQLGFSADIAEILVAVNVVLQFFIVPVNVYMMQCVILMQTKKERMINEKTLRGE